jgi:hypothetical protein
MDFGWDYFTFCEWDFDYVLLKIEINEAQRETVTRQFHQQFGLFIYSGLSL